MQDAGVARERAVTFSTHGVECGTVIEGLLGGRQAAKVDVKAHKCPRTRTLGRTRR